MVATSLAMTEKDNVLESVLEQIETMSGQGCLAGEDLTRLQQGIKLHLSGRLDWEDFHRMFKEVHPSFVTELKKRYPELSEGDLRMATYIRVGLSGKQIARMLLLQPDSVKKNRQRLRRRMRLAPDVSLEDALRRI